MTTVFSLPNLSAQETETVPVPPPFVRPSFPDKETYRAWCVNPETRHGFLSLFEGVNPGLRVSETNPVCKLHGLVAEYDAQFHPDTAGMLFPPDWVTKTFSGNGRAYWFFAEPVPMDKALWEGFKRVAFKALRAAYLAAGFKPDETRPEQYFECGVWKSAGGTPIPRNIVNVWQAEASLVSKRAGVALPLELVREEAERRFPGRWPGGWAQFQLGERGSRFWDPVGDARSVIVTDQGCVCFTGDKAFMSWADIFGQAWVDKSKGAEIGNAVNGLFYDAGRTCFYRAWTDDSTPLPISREDLKLEFRARGLSAKPPKGSLMSDQDTAMRLIQRFRYADLAAPLVFRPHGIVEIGGMQYLNTSRVRPFLPAASTHAWGDKFPWIAAFFDNAFRDQLPRFQAWWSHFYRGALKGDPGTGLALAVAGGNNAGKNFFTNGILGQAAGGKKDASRFVTGEDNFNETLVAAPLWTLHDAVISGLDNQRYSQRLKAVVANREVLTRGMFKEGVDIPWSGRVVITMNLDPESLRMLPDMSITIRDKILLLRIHDAICGRFLSDAELREELPYFCAWARDHEVPEELRDERFGVHHWHHPELLAAATAESSTQTALEILETWRVEWFTSIQTPEWRGSASQLLSLLLNSGNVGGVAGKTFRNPTALGRDARKVARQVDWLKIETGHRTQIVVQKPS
jgi:hypothetical protein